MPCAPSPPSTFCQEKVTTSSLLKSSRCAKAAEVASQIVSPCRSAGMKSAFGTRTPEVVPFQVKTTSRSKSIVDEIRQLAIVGLDRAGIGKLQLLDDIGDPAGAETLPGDHVDAARAEQRPQRHLDRAGVGGRHDADAVVGGNLQDLAGQLDRLLELVLADLGAVRSAERGHRRAPAATIRGAWRRDLRRNWDLPGAMPASAASSSWSILPDSGPSLGRGGPRTALRLRRHGVKSECLCRNGNTRGEQPQTKMADRSPPPQRRS